MIQPLVTCTETWVVTRDSSSPPHTHTLAPPVPLHYFLSNRPSSHFSSPSSSLYRSSGKDRIPFRLFSSLRFVILELILLITHASPVWHSEHDPFIAHSPVQQFFWPQFRCKCYWYTWRHTQTESLIQATRTASPLLWLLIRPGFISLKYWGKAALRRSLRKCVLTVAFWCSSCFLERYIFLRDCAPSMF